MLFSILTAGAKSGWDILVLHHKETYIGGHIGGAFFEQHLEVFRFPSK
jgi:hypothetical protein